MAIMKIQPRKLAPFGLYLALAAALVSISLYIVQHTFNLWLQISLGLIIVGLALFALLDPQRVRIALTGRQARYGSNTLILILASLGILVVVNYLVTSHSKRWDLTEDKSHTLSKETLNTINSLSKPVLAEAFYTSRVPSDTARSLLQDYKSNSNGKFDFKFIDPEADPVTAQAAKVQTDGTIVLTMAGSQEPVTTVNEENMTTALLRLANPGQRTVYFVTGNGEHDINDTSGGNTAYARVKSALESKNYTVKTINLLTEKVVPDGANVVIVAGPQKPLSADEAKILENYIAKGGSLVLMEDPSLLTQFGASPDPLADYVNQTWGITLNNDIVVDPSSQQPFAAISDVNGYGNHPITAQLKGMYTVFPSARSVTTKTVAKIDQTVLVKTASSAWGENDLAGLKANQPLAFDKSKDQAGPISMAVAAVNNNFNARLVVTGNSNFASDPNFVAYGNGDFIIDAIDWAARQDKLISLTPKTPVNRVIVPPQGYAMGLILLGTIFAIPTLVILSGIVVWIQRKRRG
jgi:ABC-type uncharacterized transport system involved in gliding motility auxiliary subunit